MANTWIKWVIWDQRLSVGPSHLGTTGWKKRGNSDFFIFDGLQKIDVLGLLTVSRNYIVIWSITRSECI